MPAEGLFILSTVIAFNHCSSLGAVGGNNDIVITIHAEF